MSLSDEDLLELDRARYEELMGEIADYYRSGQAHADSLARARQVSPMSSEERIMSPEQVDEARAAGQVFIRLLQKVRGSMRRRDRVYYELGLRAAHLEEALAQGDVERAYAHYQRILQIARMLTP
jgi:hypothetical protein